MILNHLDDNLRVLVLGHTGFLGTAVHNELSRIGANVTGVSKSTGTDIREPGALDSVIERENINVIINCAAVVGGIQFGRAHPVSIFNDNLRMTLSILETASKYGVRLINPISNCAYPKEAKLFKEEEFWNGPLDESVLVYGSIRKFSWVGASAYAQERDLKSINLVFPNMYGPGDHLNPIRAHALGALVFRFLEARSNNLSKVEIWGSGNPVREWMYIEDAVSAILASLSTKAGIEIINVGSGVGISVRDLAYEIAHQMQYRGEVVFDLSKSDGAPHKTMDGSKGRKLLNWAPKTNLKEGIGKTIKWYESQAQNK